MGPRTGALASLAGSEPCCCQICTPAACPWHAAGLRRAGRGACAGAVVRRRVQRAALQSGAGSAYHLAARAADALGADGARAAHARPAAGELQQPLMVCFARIGCCEAHWLRAKSLPHAMRRVRCHPAGRAGTAGCQEWQRSSGFAARAAEPCAQQHTPLPGYFGGVLWVRCGGGAGGAEAGAALQHRDTGQLSDVAGRLLCNRALHLETWCSLAFSSIAQCAGSNGPLKFNSNFNGDFTICNGDLYHAHRA